MARYIDPLYVLVGLPLLAAAAILWPVMRRRVKRWYLHAGMLVLPTAVPTLLSSVLGLWAAPKADAIGKPGTATVLDPTGQPLMSYGHPVRVVGRLKQPGDYLVTLGKRVFIAHIPTGYKDGELCPWLILLHGSNESQPIAFALRYCGMNLQSDRWYRFIVIYPIAQSPYTLWGTPYYAWNSRLGTLSNFNNRFMDDADFIKDVYRWVLAHTSADPAKFSLGGHSDGALLASGIAQTGAMPMKWLIACGGTMLDGQETRHPKKGPENVFLQINTSDKQILPLDTPEGKVERGTLYNIITLGGGFWNLSRSRPSLQERFWLQDALAGGSIKEIKHAYTAEGGLRCTIYFISKGGKVRAVVVWHVRGGHAWHGSPDRGIAPNLDFPLSDLIAMSVTGKAPPEREMQTVR
jgi:hypothetical protein